VGLFLAHLALAACRATALRSSGVIVSNRRLPPIFPPRLPIADITREISALLAFEGFFGFVEGCASESAVDRCTI